jgi:hypothetical protein
MESVKLKMITYKIIKIAKDFNYISDLAYLEVKASIQTPSIVIPELAIHPIVYLIPNYTLKTLVLSGLKSFVWENFERKN